MWKPPALTPAPSFHTLPPQSHTSQANDAVHQFTNPGVVLVLSNKTSQVVKAVNDRLLTLTPTSPPTAGPFNYSYTATFQKDTAFIITRSDSVHSIDLGKVELTREALTATFPSATANIAPSSDHTLSISFDKLLQSRYVDIPPPEPMQPMLRWSMLSTCHNNLNPNPDPNLNSSPNTTTNHQSLHLRLSTLPTGIGSPAILAEYIVSAAGPTLSPLHAGNWGSVTLSTNVTTNPVSLDRAFVILVVLVEAYVSRLRFATQGINAEKESWGTIAAALLCSVM